MTKKKYKECPICHGYGEIMKRDPDWDPAATPYPVGCFRCNRKGKVEVEE